MRMLLILCVGITTTALAQNGPYDEVRIAMIKANDVRTALVVAISRAEHSTDNQCKQRAVWTIARMNHVDQEARTMLNGVDESKATEPWSKITRQYQTHLDYLNQSGCVK